MSLDGSPGPQSGGLAKTVCELTSRKIGVRFIKENLILTGDDSPMATLLLIMTGSFAEFEVVWSRERQQDGIELAKRDGVYRRRKRLLTRDRAAELTRSICLPSWGQLCLDLTPTR